MPLNLGTYLSKCTVPHSKNVRRKQGFLKIFLSTVNVDKRDTVFHKPIKAMNNFTSLK
jgi:hypothetical protein